MVDAKLGIKRAGDSRFVVDAKYGIALRKLSFVPYNGSTVGVKLMRSKHQQLRHGPLHFLWSCLGRKPRVFRCVVWHAKDVQLHRVGARDFHRPLCSHECRHVIP